MKGFGITSLLLAVLGGILCFVFLAPQPDNPIPLAQPDSKLNGRWKATFPNSSEYYIVMEIEDTHFSFKDPQTLEECVSGTLTIDTSQTPHRLIMFCQKSDDAALKKLSRGEFQAVGPLIDKKIYCLFQRNGDQVLIAMRWPGKEEYPPNFVESQVLQLSKIEVP